MFRFREGQNVQLARDYPALGLKSGDKGTIWALYDVQPPSYEVTFRGPNGEPLDMTVEEPELLAASGRKGLRSKAERQTTDTEVPSGAQ